MENAEINNIIKIVGLQYKKSYEDPESLKSLRYGKIMIMTDQVSLKFTDFSIQSFLKCVWPQSVRLHLCALYPVSCVYDKDVFRGNP